MKLLSESVATVQSAQSQPNITIIINHLISPVRVRGPAILAACSVLITSALGGSFFDAAGVSGVTLGTARGGSQTFAASGSTIWNWAAFSFGAMNSSPTSSASTSEFCGDVGTMGNSLLANSKIHEKLMIFTGMKNTLAGHSTISKGSYQSTAYNSILNGVKTAATNAATAASGKPNTPFGTNSLWITSGITTTKYSPSNSTAYSGATIDSSNRAVTLKNFSGIQLGVGAAANTTYVIRLNDLLLSGVSAILTLAGTNTTNYIFNIKNTMGLSGGASIQLTGGIRAQNVLFNIENGTNNVTLGANSIMSGIILAPTRDVLISGGSHLTGEVIAKTITNNGHSLIQNPLCSP